MRRTRAVIGMLVLLIALTGCSASQRVARSPETESLLRAARVGHADTVKTLLVSPNVDVNGRDEHGNTALIEAARLGHDEVVQALLAAKADVRIKNAAGQTALMLAIEGGHDETVRLLKQAGASE